MTILDTNTVTLYAMGHEKVGQKTTKSAALPSWPWLSLRAWRSCEAALITS
jgi:hypothetical protein